MCTLQESYTGLQHWHVLKFVKFPAISAKMEEQGNAVFSFLAIYGWGFFSVFPCRNNDTFWNQDTDRKSSHCSFLLYRFCSRKLWYEKEFGVAGNLPLLKRSWDLKVSSCVRCKKHRILQAEKHKVISLDQIYGLWGCELKVAGDIALHLQPD